MIGYFLYYICILQHKKLLQRALKIFVVDVLKDWALDVKIIKNVKVVKVRFLFHTF